MKSEQKEELRHAALDILAPRYPTAMPLGGIRRRIAAEALVDFGYSDEELEAALMFLREEKFTDFTSDALGSSKWWRATSEGVKRFERA